MPSLIRRVLRRTKREIKRYIRDQRTFNLYEAARRLIANADYEQVSVARIAAEAGVSVGAFYERFPSKEDFLNRMIWRRLHWAADRARRELDLDTLRGRKPETIVRSIVEQIVTTFHGAGAGVLRAALKRASIRPPYLEPLLEYREELAERAVALLAHRVRGARDPVHAVRAIMQMVHATLLDALLQDHGPLRAGRRKTVDTITRVILLSLRINPPDISDETDDDDAMVEMPIEDPIVVEAFQPESRSSASRRHRSLRREVIAPTGMVPRKDLGKTGSSRSDASTRRTRTRLI